MCSIIFIAELPLEFQLKPQLHGGRDPNLDSYQNLVTALISRYIDYINRVKLAKFGLLKKQEHRPRVLDARLFRI